MVLIRLRSLLKLKHPLVASEESSEKESGDTLSEIEPAEKETAVSDADEESSSSDASVEDADSSNQDSQVELSEIEPEEQENLVTAPVELSLDDIEQGEQSQTTDDSASDEEVSDA